MKFTPRGIEALKPEAKRYVLWKENGDGLGIRVTPNGKKSFIYMYRFDGKAKMMTLGQYPKVSLADAGVAHSKAFEMLEHGKDPGQLKQDKKKSHNEAETINALIEEYLERWAKPRKRTWKQDERTLQKEIGHKWGDRKAKDITRRDVITLLDGIVDRGSPIQANRTLSCIRKMFNFAVARDIIEISPCYAVKAPSPEKQKDRVLSESEIASFWHGLKHPDAMISREVIIALKLLLVTAQRAGEVTNSEWKEFDLTNRWWIIPLEKAKNGLSHRVPLSPKAIALLYDLQILTGNSRWLFPSKKNDDKIDKPIGDAVLCKAVSRNAAPDIDAFKITKFTPHDLRRTAASHMTSMGIQRLTVSKILNHVERGSTPIYDRYSYDNEKQHALDAWCKKLESLIDGKDQSNVVTLKQV
jgi:integrase